MSRLLKESGHAWLGRVPAHWQLVPLGRVFRERKTTVSDVDFEPLSVSMGGVVPRMENVALTANNESRKLVRAGDYVINSRSDRKGSGGIASMDGSVSVISTVLRPIGIVPSYAHHLLRSPAFQEEFYRWGTGIVADLWSTRYASMSKITLPLPPVAEQHAIADFLDRETAKIDALIEKQKEMIGLLGDRRTALVIRATSRGIGEQQLRPSSMYWAPLIPEGWCEQPLKHVLENIQSGIWGEDEDGGVNDIPCVRVADFDRPRLRVGNPPTIRKVSPADRMKCRLVRGDLLIEKSGGTGINPVGFVVTYDGDATAVFANFIARLRIKEAHNSRYWLYALYGSYAGGLTWRSVKQTTGIQNLDMSSLLAETFPVPDRQSQDDVVEHLDRETARIDSLIAKAEDFIALARERRAALITAAVTGQIDVLGKAG